MPVSKRRGQGLTSVSGDMVPPGGGMFSYILQKVVTKSIFNSKLYLNFEVFMTGN